jgi:DNA-binding XRE family transcriptional regulator
MMAKKPLNSIDMHVGSRMRVCRMMLGMSQTKLGDALGITFQQLQKNEKGTKKERWARAQKVGLARQAKARALRAIASS